LTSTKWSSAGRPEFWQAIFAFSIVRLIWTSRMSDKSRSETTTIKEKGLDVFKRQGDGSWKIVISYAYPQSEKTQTIKTPSSY
jgi:ketosteroid isomerase-like protein